MKLLPLLLATAFSVTLPATYAADTNNPPVSPEERAKIEAVVNQYLLSKPEVVVEALQIFQQQQYTQTQQIFKKTQQDASQFANALFHTAGDPIAGNPNGTLTIVEFFDYQCQHCVQMAPVLSDLIKANGNVRIVYKELPLRSPMSELAARAALAANKQNKYLAFQHALFASSKPISEEVILQVAGAAGLNVEQLKTDMKSESIDKQIKATKELAQQLKLLGTPAFFIGKTEISDNKKDAIIYIPGQMSLQQLQTELGKIK
jgi:protein-disulfide isomerase